MKTTTLILALTAAAAFAQGPLTPPGAPAATGKSLTEIYDRTEKRTPISSLPFNITQGGSYYLTQSLSGAGQASGITISVSNVTLDLNGFTLDGSNIASPAIATVGGLSQITVRNGHITLWNAAGLDLSSAGNVAVEKVTVRATGGKGIRTGYYSTVSDCRVDEVGAAAYDIGSQSTVRNCVAGRPNGEGFLLADDVNAEQLVVYQTLGTGNAIHMSTGTNVSKVNIRSASALGIFGLGQNTIVDCTVDGAATGGIDLGPESSARGCHVRNATGDAVAIGVGSRISDSTASNPNGRGFVLGVGTSAEGLTVRGTQGGNPGIYLNTDATAVKCVVTNATGYGFRAFDRTTIRGCSASNCGTSGFYVGNKVTIEHCNATSNVSSGYSIGSDCSLKSSISARQRNPAYNIETGAGVAWVGVYVSGEGNTVTDCSFNNNDFEYYATAGAGPSGYNESIFARNTSTVRSPYAPYYYTGSAYPRGSWLQAGDYHHVRSPDDYYFENTNTYTVVPN